MEYSSAVVHELSGRVTLAAIQEARLRLAPHLARTPLLRHPLLEAALGFPLWVKHENHLPTGAFKVRGGVNYMARLAEPLRRRGVITATRGNHGQSIALAARLFGARCVIVVPRGNNPEKNAAMIAYGAGLIEHGADYDEARIEAEALAEAQGLTYVHGGNEPDLINGVGTLSLEILEDLPEVEVLILPVGGGSALCGAITVFRALKPEVTLIGVQAAGAPSVYESWRRGVLTPTASAVTLADGLATRCPFELPFSILRDGVDRMVLVSEAALRSAIRLLLQTTHNLAEGAGAAATAAARDLQKELKGRNVVVVLSGGNIDLATLRAVLAEADDEP